jgi:hypothetical protein
MKSLTAAQTRRALALERTISALARREPLSPREASRLGNACREAVRLYRAVVTGRPGTDETGVKSLATLARRAMLLIGGEGDVGGPSLKDYDHKRFGPYLGVSDEGSAAAVICQAALDSPKARALGGAINPLAVGVALDAERLGGVGEVAVGPEEYVEARTACLGRILNSTNIGTRVNLRFFRRHPVVWAENAPFDKALGLAKDSLRLKVAPFLRPPGGKARPLTVYAAFPIRNRWGDAKRTAFLKELSTYLAKADVADPKVHHLGYQASVRKGAAGKREALRALKVAAGAGLKDVSLSGTVRKLAEELVSQPGLLNYLPPGQLGPILRRAAALGVRMRPVNTVDPETVARHVWTGLQAARRTGFELGKYGLFPLTFEESEVVIGLVQKWFKRWSAAPVFFVDQGLLSETRVDTSHDLVRGLKTWLRMVGRHGVRVVLIDTVEKSKCLPLLQTSGAAKGLMSFRQVADVDKLAKGLGIKALWAGGISIPQIYELGRLGVFGIYVTSAAAELIPVPPGYEKDPWLAGVKEPTYDGVFRTKLLLEAGFLSAHAPDGPKIGRVAEAYLSALSGGDKTALKRAQDELANECKSAWRRFWAARPQKRSIPQRQRRPA